MNPSLTKEEKLIEAAKAILSANDECLLSGSLALKLQGRKLRRDPKDLDIFLPFTKSLTIVDGLKIRTNDGDNDEYDDEYFERVGYTYYGIDVDVFTPIHSSVPEFLDIDAKGFQCVIDFEIIKMKVSHSFGEHWTRDKHRFDIIHLMANA